MVLTVDLPERVVRAIDKRVRQLRLERPKAPEWPFEGEVVVELLGEEGQRKLAKYQAELERFQAFRTKHDRPKCSRSTVANTAISQMIEYWKKS